MPNLIARHGCWQIKAHSNGVSWRDLASKRAVKGGQSLRLDHDQLIFLMAGRVRLA